MDLDRLRAASEAARARLPKPGPLAAFLRGLRTRPELEGVVGLETGVMLPVPVPGERWTLVTVVGLRQGQGWSPARFRLSWDWPEPETVQVERLEVEELPEEPSCSAEDRVRLLAALEHLRTTDPTQAPDLEPLIVRLAASWPSTWWDQRGSAAR